jgi:hypothetical protein
MLDKKITDIVYYRQIKASPPKRPVAQDAASLAERAVQVKAGHELTQSPGAEMGSRQSGTGNLKYISPGRGNGP